MKPLIRFLLCYLTLLILSGCGFHLRGQSDHKLTVDNSDTVIYVPSSNIGQSFAKQITLALQQAQFSITKEADNADYQLMIINIKIQQKAIGIDDLGRNNEFEVSLFTKYLILPKQTEQKFEDELLDQYSFSHQLQQSVYIDANDVIGKRAELKMIHQQLYQKMTDKVLAQLNQIIAVQLSNEKQG
ncbi:MAG: hypothetical protein Q9M92_09030 [Enterobacterales bacterium]|nr:hypothetical protein [Enterobacterales bacterium]